MAGFGSSIKLQGESEYQRALKQINQSLREVGSEMKIVSANFDKNDKSTQAMAQRSDVLNKKLEEQKNKLSVLTQKYNEMNATYCKNSTAQKELTAELTKEKAKLDEIGSTLGKTSKEYQEQQKVVNDLENKQTSYNNAVSKAKTEMNLAQAEVNKTTKELDELGKETQDVEQKVKGAGDGFTVFKGILANLGTQAINLAMSGLKKMGSALIDVGKQAIESYADYEQLVGGVDTLFKDSSKTIQKYASQAYKTAGISANQYMEQITSFSASLIQSLGGDTQKAAEYGNRAIVDMSDNANKMGTAMESIQYAYQGFAKQNYTMLDNLKLGYGGTKTEMQRLIKDASKMTDIQKKLGITVDESSMSFGNIVNAISVMQDHLGIAGTTSKEASETISGSVNSMKSAWQNLLTGLADENQEVGPLIQQFIDSVATAWENLKPRIKETINGIKQAIAEIWEKRDEIGKEIPELQPLIDGLEWVIDNKELVVGALAAIIGAMAVGKIAGFINTMATLGTTLAGIPAVTGLASTAMTMLGGAFTFMTGPIGIAIITIGAVVGAFVLLWKKSESFRNFWIGLWENIKSAFSTAKDGIVNGFNAFVDFIKELPSKIWNFLSDVINKVIEFRNNLIKKAIEIGTNFVNNIINFYKQLPSKIWNLLTQVITKVTTFARDIGAKAKEAGQNVVNNITNKIKNLPKQMLNWGKDMIQGLINGIKSMIGKVGDTVKGVANKIKSFLHFSKPDEGPLREYEEWMPDFIQGLSNSLDKASPKLINEVKSLSSEMANAMQPNLALNGSNLNETSPSGINTLSNYNSLVEAFETALEGMKIELDDEEVGSFVKKTVENAIYN